MSIKTKHYSPRSSDRAKDSDGSPQNKFNSEVSELQRLLETERLRTRKLELVLRHKEEQFRSKEAEYIQIITEYEQTLRTRMDLALAPVTELSGLHLDRVKQLHSQMMALIANFQGTASQVLTNQEKDIARRFNTKLTDLKITLEKEKREQIESLLTKRHEVVSQSKELEQLKVELEEMGTKNSQLQLINRDLRMTAKAQEDANVLLIERLTEAKRRIAKMEEEMDKKNIVPEVDSQSLPKLPKLKIGDNNRDKEDRGYAHSITHLKKMLDSERKAVKAVRASYARELSKKSDLESVLRLCLEDLKTEHHRLKLDKSFEVAERKTLMEKVLNHEKIMTFLIDHLFNRETEGRHSEE